MRDVGRLPREETRTAGFDGWQRRRLVWSSAGSSDVVQLRRLDRHWEDIRSRESLTNERAVEGLR